MLYQTVENFTEDLRSSNLLLTHPVLTKRAMLSYFYAVKLDMQIMKYQNLSKQWLRSRNPIQGSVLWGSVMLLPTFGP